jgi:hypothetical protein
MSIRVSADQAGWTIREAAWGLEERVIWRGSDATRQALERASSAIAPLQRLIQTKLTWPVGDAFRARGRATRRTIAASAAVLAIGAGAAGAISAPGGATPEHAVPPSVVASVTAAPDAVHAVSLQGVTPQFQPAHQPAAELPPAKKPSTPAAEVAWQFAGAFVGYEVGHSSDKTDVVFAGTATKQLAKALATDPPRLPASGKVPRARVLNVVIGEQTKNQVTASVSLVRLRAISELRLTLTRSGRDWRVAQVLG